jgi:site-specific recombinase XerD
MSVQTLSADTCTDRFLQFLEAEKNASPHTIKNYRSDLREFIAFLGKRSLQEIDYLMIRKFLAHLKDREALKSTISRKLACLKSFFKYLTREGLVETNPASSIATPKRERRLPSFLEVNEVAHLIEVTQGTSWELKRDRSILEVLYGSGIRSGELVGLNMDDVDLLSGMLKVRGKGKKERIVPVGSCAIAALQAYLEAAPTAGSQRTQRSKCAANHSALRQTRSPEERNFSSYVATYLCNPFAGSRCGLKKCSRIAGACPFINHPNLHTCNRKTVARSV